MNKKKLSCDRVHKSFKQGNLDINVLQNISVEFQQGKTYAIRGVSGTGKSTLMHILAGIDTPSSGTVFFNDCNLSSFSANERASFFNKSIGLMFQSPYLIRELSVLENIIMPGLLAGADHKSSMERAQILLKEVDLSDKALLKPGTLSGGQQQRVALARALFNKPVFLLADELTGNLDIKTGKSMLMFLLHSQKLYGMGIIVSTHDQYVADSMEIVYQLRDGKLTKIKN